MLSILQGMRSYVLKYETYSFIAPCNGVQGAEVQYAADQTRNTGAHPPPFSLPLVYWDLLCALQHVSNSKDTAILVMCLACKKDTSVTTYAWVLEPSL